MEFSVKKQVVVSSIITARKTEVQIGLKTKKLIKADIPYLGCQ
jgi:hypothetical protein